MGTIAGSNTYGLILSSLNTGSVPAGDIIYLIGKLARWSRDYQNSIKTISGNYSYSNRDGKISKKLVFSECYVILNVAGSNTAEINLITQQFDKWHDSGDAPIYAWVKNLQDNVYIDLGYESGAAVDWLKGYLRHWEVELAEGNLYYLKNVQFEGCGN